MITTDDATERLRLMEEAKHQLLDSLAEITRNLAETEFSAIKAGALVNDTGTGQLTIKFEIDFKNHGILASSLVPIPKMIKRNHSVAKFAPNKG